MGKMIVGACGVVLFGTFARLSGVFAGPVPRAEPQTNETMQCVVNWKADSEVCRNQKDAAGGKCTEKYQGDHASVDEAKERCEHIYGVHRNSGRNPAIHAGSSRARSKIA